MKMTPKAPKTKIKVDKIDKMKIRNQCTKKKNLKKHCGKKTHEVGDNISKSYI